MAAEYLQFSNATVEMIVKGVNTLERAAWKCFVSSGRHNDAEEWHKVRNAKEEVEGWIKRLAQEDKSGKKDTGFNQGK